MRFKIQAGAEIETVTPDELRATLAAWIQEVARGVKLRHFQATATVTVGNTFSIDGGSVADELGPRKDMVWKVLSVAFGGSGFLKGTDTVSIFIGDATDSRLVTSGVTRSFTFAPHYLSGGEALSFTGAATDTGDQVIVSGWALEAPASLLSELL